MITPTYCLEEVSRLQHRIGEPKQNLVFSLSRGEKSNFNGIKVARTYKIVYWKKELHKEPRISAEGSP